MNSRRTDPLYQDSVSRDVSCVGVESAMGDVQTCCWEEVLALRSEPKCGNASISALPAFLA